MEFNESDEYEGVSKNKNNRKKVAENEDDEEDYESIESDNYKDDMD